MVTIINCQNVWFPAYLGLKCTVVSQRISVLWYKVMRHNYKANKILDIADNQEGESWLCLRRTQNGQNQGLMNPIHIICPSNRFGNTMNCLENMIQAEVFVGNWWKNMTINFLLNKSLMILKEAVSVLATSTLVATQKRTLCQFI